MRSWKLFSKQILWIWKSGGTHAHPLRLLFYWCLEHFRQPCHTTVEKQLVDCPYLQTSMPVKHKRGWQKPNNRSPPRIPGIESQERVMLVVNPFLEAGTGELDHLSHLLCPSWKDLMKEVDICSLLVFSRCECYGEDRDCPVGGLPTMPAET